MQDALGSERGEGSGVGLTLQAVQEADKPPGIPDHPQKTSQQVASCNSSHLSAVSWGSLGLPLLHLPGSGELLGLKQVPEGTPPPLQALVSDWRPGLSGPGWSPLPPLSVGLCPVRLPAPLLLAHLPHSLSLLQVSLLPSPACLLQESAFLSHSLAFPWVSQFLPANSPGPRQCLYFSLFCQTLVSE